jgi:hypothetical protein
VLESFPLENKLLAHAEVADLSKRSEVSFQSVKYFVDMFPTLKPSSSGEEDGYDILEIEFLKYQVDKLPENILKCERADVQWHQLGQMKDYEANLKYSNLSRVMLAILVIPHSNADSERVFSAVRRIQTEFRPNMGRELLESLVVCKSNMNSKGTACFEQKFSKVFLTKAKGATYQRLKTKNLNDTNCTNVAEVALDRVCGDVLNMLCPPATPVNLCTGKQ